MAQPTSQTIYKSYRARMIKASVLGFVLSVSVILPALIYIAKEATEQEGLARARAATYGFRQKILEGNIRYALSEMKDALGLKPGESIVFRDKHMAPKDPSPGFTDSTCSSGRLVCWTGGFQLVHYLYPIYFDEDARLGLAGYLDFGLKPLVNRYLYLLVLVALVVVFVVQGLGLTLSGLRSKVEQLEAIAEEKGKAAGQLSILNEIGHDLKTPLSQNAKFFSFLVEEMRETGKVNEELVTYLESTLGRMNDIVTQVRSMNTDTARHQPPIVLLEDEVQKYLDEIAFNSEISQKSISINFHRSSELTKAQISPVSLYRIMDNLVRNAVQAVGPKGEITFSVSHVEKDKKKLPVLEVTDNGAGIPLAVRDRIFDFAFSTKAAAGGTGLGLGIAKNLCDQANAEISFLSEVGKGTSFRVAFQPEGMEH